MNFTFIRLIHPYGIHVKGRFKTEIIYKDIH